MNSKKRERPGGEHHAALRRERCSLNEVRSIRQGLPLRPMSAPKPRFFLGKKATPASSSRPSAGFTSRVSTSASTSSSSTKPPPPPPDQPISSQTDRRFVEYSSPEDVCPVCKNDRYLNPKLRLMVSKCYHKMYASLSHSELLDQS